MIDTTEEQLPMPNPWLQAIRALAAGQRFQEAEQKAYSWTMLESTNALAWRQLAAMREYQQNYQGALLAASEAIRYDGSNPASWWYRGYQHLLTNDAYRAELDFDRALHLSVTSSSDSHVEISHLMRAQARRQLGDYQGALDDCAHVASDCTFWLHGTITKEELTAQCMAALQQGIDDDTEDN